MLRAIIVEDEKNESNRLSSFLKRFSDENHVGFDIKVFSSGLTFLSEYNISADIVFMDIELPDVDGMEICRRLRKIDKKVIIIFVTNMAQYAVKGYEVNAMDFMIKPIYYAEFSVKLKRAIDYISLNEGRFIMLSYYGMMRRLNVNEIYYVEVISHHIIYHTGIGNIEIKGTLKEAEELLAQYGFSRCNNCYLVNLKHVIEINETVAVLLDGSKLSVSRNKKKDFLKNLTDFWARG